MIRLITIMTIVMLLFAACAEGETEVADGEFVDGTYTVAHDYADARGWRSFLQITVEDGAIAAVDFDYVNADSVRKSEDDAYNQRWRGALDGEMDMVMAREAFEESLVNQQNVPIDVVTGATGSSELMNRLAERALEMARDGESGLGIVPYDLTVTAEDEVDQRGWIAQIEIDFDDGGIVAVDYDEVQKEDGEIVNRKSEDEAYAERWEGAEGVSQMTAFPEFEQQLVETGDPDAVDNVTGATGSWERFVNVARRALNDREAPDLPVSAD